MPFSSQPCANDSAPLDGRPAASDGSQITSPPTNEAVQDATGRLWTALRKRDVAGVVAAAAAGADLNGLSADHGLGHDGPYTWPLSSHDLLGIFCRSLPDDSLSWFGRAVKLAAPGSFGSSGAPLRGPELAPTSFLVDPSSDRSAIDLPRSDTATVPLPISPLEFARRARRADLQQALLDAGADPLALGCFLSSSLALAIHEPLSWIRPMVHARLDAAQALLESAIDRDLPALVEVALTAFPPGNAGSYWPRVLSRLLRRHPTSTIIFQALIEKGADLTHLPGSYQSGNALHEIITDDPAWVHRLIGLGVDVNGRDANGNTPLHRLPQQLLARQVPLADAIAVVTALRDHGANLQARNVRGETPLWTAAEHALPDPLLACLIGLEDDPDPCNSMGVSLMTFLQQRLDEQHVAVAHWPSFTGLHREQNLSRTQAWLTQRQHQCLQRSSLHGGHTLNVHSTRARL